MPKEFFVIERYIEGQIHYWSINHPFSKGVKDENAGEWVSSIHEATHFSREVDGEGIRYVLLKGLGRTIEHSYLDNSEG